MPEVVVVGVDGSEAGERAATFAVSHMSDPGSTVLVAYVIPWSPFTLQTAEENARRATEKDREIKEAQEHVIDPLLAKLAEHGPATVEGVVRHGHPAETLCNIAEERGADHVLVGRIGQSRVRALLFGSTPGNLIQISTVPVTVVP